METPKRTMTMLLGSLDLGDTAQADELLGLVYDELRALAAAYMRREPSGHTLQPTALVHEAYLRLVGGEEIDWRCRARFFGIAARSMRQVLVDHARRRQAAKRGGDQRQVTLQPDLLPDGEDTIAILELHDALERLAALDPELARLVEVRFFTGLTLDDTARALGVSRRKAAKDWSVARLWLNRELARG